MFLRQQSFYKALCCFLSFFLNAVPFCFAQDIVKDIAHNNSSSRTFTGKVIAANTRLPLRGAKVQLWGVLPTKKPITVYSSVTGEFRCVFTRSAASLLQSLPVLTVRRLGYDSLAYTPDAMRSLIANMDESANDSARVSLGEIPLSESVLRYQAVSVAAELSAEQIIQRFTRQHAQRQGFTPFVATVFEKLYATSATRSILPFLVQCTTDTLQQETIAEEQRQPQAPSQRVVVQQRSTGHAPIELNFAGLGAWVNAADASIKLGNTTLTTPCALNALELYDFMLQERREDQNRTLYVLAFAPRRSTIAPTLAGTITLERTAHNDFFLREIDAALPPQTCIATLPAVHLYQQFETVRLAHDSSFSPINSHVNSNSNESNSPHTATVPAYSDFTAEFAFDLARWISECRVSYRAESVLMSIHHPKSAEILAFGQSQHQQLAKTLLASATTGGDFLPMPSSATPYNVATFRVNDTSGSLSDSLSDSLLETPSHHALRTQLSAKLHAKLHALHETAETFSSLAQATNTSEAKALHTPPPERSFFRASWTSAGMITLPLSLTTDTLHLGLTPVIDRSRTTGLMLGADVLAQWRSLSVGLRGAVGLASPQLFGETELRWNFFDNGTTTVFANGSVYSRLQTLQDRPSYLRFLNAFVVRDLLFEDRFDFYREEGVSIGAGLRHETPQGQAAFSVNVAEFAHQSLTALAGSVRPNMPIESGIFRQASAEAAWNYTESDLFASLPLLRSSQSGRFGLKIRGLAGYNLQTPDKPFFRGEVSAKWLQPTFQTGYLPMYLNCAFSAGRASAETPLQRQFVMMQRVRFMGRFTDFLTLSGSSTGGTEYASLHVEHSFSDVVWRALGLPLYDGRGVELLLLAQALHVRQTSANESANVLHGANGMVAELGIGISRIPTFISSVMYLRFDMLWRVTPLENVNDKPFGFSIAWALPF
ncbi:MAG: hypothetical protein EAZ92_09105 [Candidatus Kapaibacterium sp.]|nr:MAG: hypothetical protein EAZ92_09105 [Candidatus Kapabacteria bacterium]